MVSEKEIRSLRAGIQDLKKDLASAEQQARSGGNQNSVYIQTIRQAIADDQARLDSLIAQRDAEKQDEAERLKEAERQEKIRYASQKTNWFAGIDNKEALKREYKRLAREYHPDKLGGHDEIMSRINAEYNAAMDRVSAETQQAKEQPRQQRQQTRQESTQDYAQQSTYTEPEPETEYDDDYEEYEEPTRRSSGTSDALEIERERTRRQKQANRALNRRQRERYRFEQHRYRQYQRREARRAVQRAVAHGVHNAAVASKKQKHAQAQTGGLRVRPDEPRLVDKLPISTNPAYTAWGGIGTGALLMLGTRGAGIPLILTTLAGITSLGLEDSDAREIAIGATFGAGILGLVRLLGKAGGTNG